MFRKFISKGTAVILLASGMSALTALPSQATNFTIDCSTIVSGQTVFVPMTGTSKDVTLSGTCVRFYWANGQQGIVQNGLTLTALTNSSIDSNGYAVQTTANTSWDVNIAGNPVSTADPTSNNAIVGVMSASNVYSRFQFVTPEFYANADLHFLSIMGATLSPTFSGSTTSYTASTSTNISLTAVPVARKLGVNSASNALIGSAACDGTSMSMAIGTTLGQYQGTCTLTAGSNKVITLTVTALDGTTTKTYTITVTAASGGGGGGAPSFSTSISNITSTSATFDYTSIGSNAITSSISTFVVRLYASSGSTVLKSESFARSSGFIQTISGLSPSTTYRVQVVDPVMFIGWIPAAPFTTLAGSSSTPTLTAAEIAANAAAAAKAAAEAAAAVRAAEVATAQAKLATVLKGDKAGSIDEYKAANISISTAASLARINAEVLKLSANDRADFTKIKAIADKIEFDESFFNATARPTVAIYSQYGVTVTDRTVATINAKVLELPIAKRTDVTAIAEIAKVETFVDRVANPATRLSVPAATLVSKGLLPADSPYKYSVIQGLAMYPEGSLNTMAKIEAAIKAEVDKAGARKAKTEAIKAKIAARRG